MDKLICRNEQAGILKWINWFVEMSNPVYYNR